MAKVPDACLPDQARGPTGRPVLLRAQPSAATRHNGRVTDPAGPHDPTLAPLPAREWPDGELHFARMILGDRRWNAVPDAEVRAEAEALLTAWMGGEIRMERPKLYDHYALPLLALLRHTRALEARVAALEAQLGTGKGEQ